MTDESEQRSLHDEMKGQSETWHMHADELEKVAESTDEPDTEEKLRYLIAGARNVAMYCGNEDEW